MEEKIITHKRDTTISQIKVFALHVACCGLIPSNIYGHLNTFKIDPWAKNQKKVLSGNFKKCIFVRG